MIHVYTVTNQKGGAGKTTTVLALGSGLSESGFRVLLIDLDAQCNMTWTARAKTDGLTIYHVLKGEVEAVDAVQHTEIGDVIAGSRQLTESAAATLLNGPGREYRLKEVLEPLWGAYDYIIIDTPPALGILNVNALTTCDSVIIPIQTEAYGLQGMNQLMETAKTVRKYYNKSLNVEGILLTRYNARLNISQQITATAEKLAKDHGIKLFKTKIRDAVAVREAQARQMSLHKYKPDAIATIDYNDFISELIGKE